MRLHEVVATVAGCLTILASVVFLTLFGSLLFLAFTSPTLTPSGACPSGYQIGHFLGTDLCVKP